MAQILTPEVIMAAATLVMAAFTGFVAALNWRHHKLTNEARIEVVAKDAVVYETKQWVRVEVLLWNRSQAPAVIQDWEIELQTRDWKQQIGNGRLVMTEIFKMPVYVGGKGWSLTRKEPMALSLVADTLKPFEGAADVAVKLRYLGKVPAGRGLRWLLPGDGAPPRAVLKDTIRVRRDSTTEPIARIWMGRRGAVELESLDTESR